MIRFSVSNSPFRDEYRRRDLVVGQALFLQIYLPLQHRRQIQNADDFPDRPFL